MKLKTLTTLASIGLAATSANAATIIYSFETNNTAGGTNITHAASSNDFGSGITVSLWSATAGESGRPVYIDGQQMRMEKGGSSDTHTFTITIPDLGSNTVSLTNLAFDYGKVGADNGVPTWTVTSDLGSGTITPNTANEASTSANISEFATMALAGTFTGLNNTNVTFTLVDAAGGNNNQGNNGANNHYSFIDNVTITGTVDAVPEPSTTALLGLGGLALILRRRK